MDIDLGGGGGDGGIEGGCRDHDVGVEANPENRAEEGEDEPAAPLWLSGQLSF